MSCDESVNIMINVAIIDDDDSELRIWRLIHARHFDGAVDFRLFQSIEAAVEDIAKGGIQAVVVDNNIPPHKTAHFALERLADIGFQGRIIVFSNHQVEELGKLLGPMAGNVELVSKQTYVSTLDLVDFMKNIVLAA